jgi:hypothetical protein
MNKDQYFEKHRLQQIEQQELERKWRVFNEQKMIQDMAIASNPFGGGVAGTPHVAGVDFTIEWFIKATSWTSPTSHPRPFSLGTYPAPNAVSIETGGDSIYWWTNGLHPVDKESGLGLTTGTWYHFAITRNNGALNIYKDGVSISTGTFNDAIPSMSNDLWIGAEPASTYDSSVNGKMSNFRWTAKCIYTSDFTVPTSPLTALPETKLLLLAATSTDKTVDSSSYARTVTNVGSVTWDADDPFGGISGAGSLVFADGKYLTIPASTDWDL